MSDTYHNHNTRPKQEDFDDRVLIKDNWITDAFGMVDVAFFTESCFRHGSQKSVDVLNKLRPWCIYCKYPNEIVED